MRKHINTTKESRTRKKQTQQGVLLGALWRPTLGWSDRATGFRVCEGEISSGRGRKEKGMKELVFHLEKMSPMRIVKQSTVKQFTSENHRWVLALSCSCSGSGDVQSFIWIPPKAGIMHDSVVWGDHSEHHAGCDFLFLFLKRKIYLVSSPILGWSWDDNSNFFLNKHRP